MASEVHRVPDELGKAAFRVLPDNKGCTSTNVERAPVRAAVAQWNHLQLPIWHRLVNPTILAVQTSNSLILPTFSIPKKTSRWGIVFGIL